jgi:predicted lipid-binding transport protein (Tim44 family)
MSELRTRRREARRRRRVLRGDLAAGLLGGIVLLLATAGLAIAALIAFGLIGLCALSIVVERRRRSRRGWAERARPADGAIRRPSP